MSAASVDDVGKIRFCAACGRTVKTPVYEVETEDANEAICSCCKRPMMACPCDPVAPQDKPCSR